MVLHVALLLVAWPAHDCSISRWLQQNGACENELKTVAALGDRDCRFEVSKVLVLQFAILGCSQVLGTQSSCFCSGLVSSLMVPWLMAPWIK
jgi:hypothetical protein